MTNNLLKLAIFFDKISADELPKKKYPFDEEICEDEDDKLFQLYLDHEQELDERDRVGYILNPDEGYVDDFPSEDNEVSPKIKGEFEGRIRQNKETRNSTSRIGKENYISAMREILNLVSSDHNFEADSEDVRKFYLGWTKNDFVLYLKALNEPEFSKKLAKPHGPCGCAEPRNDHSDVSNADDSLFEDDSWEDQLPGGLADKKKPSDFKRPALLKGIKVEIEHTTDEKVALEIAMDHLTEDPDYYDKLAVMEENNADDEDHDIPKTKRSIIKPDDLPASSRKDPADLVTEAPSITPEIKDEWKNRLHKLMSLKKQFIYPSGRLSYDDEMLLKYRYYTNIKQIFGIINDNDFEDIKLFYPRWKKNDFILLLKELKEFHKPVPDTSKYL